MQGHVQHADAIGLVAAAMLFHTAARSQDSRFSGPAQARLLAHPERFACANKGCTCAIRGCPADPAAGFDAEAAQQPRPPGDNIAG